MDNAFSLAKQFFEQPDEAKQAVQVNQWQRGYMPPAHVTIPGHLPDLKEVFEIGVDLAVDDPDVLAGKPLHGHNQWPQLRGFRKAMDAYFHAVTAAGRALLVPLAIALRSTRRFFCGALRSTTHQDEDHALFTAAAIEVGASVQHCPAYRLRGDYFALPGRGRWSSAALALRRVGASPLHRELVHREHWRHARVLD